VRKVKVAAVQMDVLLGDVQANLNKCQDMLERCAQNKVDFAVLPEMWLTGYSFRNLLDLAQRTHAGVRWRIRLRWLKNMG
jgi:omega-amidase